MPKARKDQEEKVVQIIMQTYANNPSVYTIIGKGGNQKRKLRRLALFAIERAKNRDGVYISNNEKGMAFCFRSDKNTRSFKEIWNEIRLALVVPWKNITYGLKRERIVKRIRKSEPHYYFWFYGVSADGGRAAYELKDELFQKAKTERLPIFAETSVERNKKVYERFGFEVYDEYNDPTGITIWFMEKRFEHE